MEGHLWKLIQKHLDDYGVREAEFARRIGTSPQTVSSWKKRGIRSLPKKDLLVGVSDVTRQPYDAVLTAVLHDIEYLPKDVAQHATPKTQAGASPATDVQVSAASAADEAEAFIAEDVEGRSAALDASSEEREGVESGGFEDADTIS